MRVSLTNTVQELVAELCLQQHNAEVRAPKGDSMKAHDVYRLSHKFGLIGSRTIKAQIKNWCLPLVRTRRYDSTHRNAHLLKSEV